MNNQNVERELGWDDEIQKDGGEFIILPEGEYDFTVTKFERGRFAGSDKMPACNQAKLELKVHSPQYGDVVVFHTLLLHTKTEGFLSSFFSGIGQKKKGEKLKMNWQTVIGSKGRLKLSIRKFKGNDGVERTNNEVRTFIPYEDAFPAGQQQYQQQYQQQQASQQQYQQHPFPGTSTNGGGGWAPGQF